MGKSIFVGTKYIKNAETFPIPWHIVQEGMSVILRDIETRLPMQSFEFTPGTLPFLTRNVLTFITKFHNKVNING